MENKIKVVIPTDFSIQGEYAYVMVKNLSDRLDMDVTFLHVLSVPDTVEMDVNGNISTCGDIDVSFVEKQKEMAERKLNEIKATHGDHLNTAVVLGKTTTGIINYAEQNNYDLIVMGTKGASGITERIVGSEAQIIARKSTVPVLSLMCDRSNFELKNIVLVHDFKVNGKQNLGLLSKFMQSFGTKVHLLEVSSGKEADKAVILSNMEKFAQNNDIPSYESHVLFDKDIEAGVIHFNQMNNMDMVCVGTQGKGSIFSSDAAEGLINHMYKPVITYRTK